MFGAERGKLQLAASRPRELALRLFSYPDHVRAMPPMAGGRLNKGATPNKRACPTQVSNLPPPGRAVESPDCGAINALVGGYHHG